MNSYYAKKLTSSNIEISINNLNKNHLYSQNRQNKRLPPKANEENEIISKNQKDYVLEPKKESVFSNSKETKINKADIELEFKKNRRVSNRTLRRKLYRKYAFLKNLSTCNSKIKLIRIFSNLSPKWKSFMKYYLSNCFIKHLCIRQIKNFNDLLAKRSIFFQALDDPQLFINQINFGNNIIKNFCKGVCNFIVMFYKELTKNNYIPH